MRLLLTNEQMREADGYTIDVLGVPSLTLMERAGTALANEAVRLAPTGKILCVCGGGNNGGDGFVCARILRERGREAEAVFFAKRTSDECRCNLEKFRQSDGVIYEEIPSEEYALIVDCLLGTGFKGALSDEYAQRIEKMNACKKRGVKILSADIPSGVRGDDGSVNSVAVCADETLCIGEQKTGVLLGDGIDYSGVVKTCDIGIQLPRPTDEYAYVLEKTDVAALLPKRKRNTHKGSYGRAAIVAGSKEYTGAAYLSTAACLRAGAGYTTLFTPPEILPYYILKAPEALLRAWTDEALQELLAYDAVAYGMGMGVSESVANGAKYLLAHFTGTLILDADAINALAFYEKENLTAVFAAKKCGVVLTPHIKEFSRLTGESVQTLLEKGVFAPFAFAKKHDVTVLLKNAVSVVTEGKRTAVNTTGNAGQAKGGSGDVLSGVLAALCAQGLSAFDGACVGAYLTGRAAELASQKVGEYSLLATDVIAYLGASFLSLGISENADKNGGEQ